MSKSLVIVESPTKARTIARFLGEDYVVESSIGHIRDLPSSAEEIPEGVKGQPWTRLGINIEDDFHPLYVIPGNKKEQVRRLKTLLKGADQIYLATDEDREGESISWHLREVLQPKVPIHRLVFHEITREAIQNALRHPRTIDERLVKAQETRRILDRLYGYEISPLLWRKIAPNLSAGRVQSVAVRMIVNRERERMKFRSATFWDLEATFAASDGGVFKATLTTLDGRRLASGKDFENTTGQLIPGREVAHLNETAARTLAARLDGVDFRVVRVDRKPYKSAPPAPFTTSTLQQEGNRKLGFSSRETMRVAQSLYEQGHITYMRTDSTTLSDQAIQAARTQVEELYGADYLPAVPRVFRSRVKNAQEAHEAIRPAGESFRKPDSLRGELNPAEQKLYDMIWKRTVACQMTEASGHRITLGVEGDAAVFQAGGKTIEFPGFLRAYVEGSDDPEAELGDQERLLPAVNPGERLARRGFEPQEHSTQPPARFTEASLIKELEKEGIGRPSTYSSIINTITERGYITRKGNAMVPSFTAFAVIKLLEEYFKHLVDIAFTAKMEDALDAISRGEQESLPYLTEFYRGSGDLPGLKDLLGAEIDARTACTIPLPGQEDRQPPHITVRIGKYGPYLERETERAPLPAILSPDELTLETAADLLRRGSQPDVLGQDPESGKSVYLKNGRFGPYVQLGETGEEPKMKSLLPGQTPEDISLEAALRLLSLPRTVGTDPETGEPIIADLGRFGPYLRRGAPEKKETRTLPTPEAVFTLTLEEAQALLLLPKYGKGSARGAATILKELGPHPQSGAVITVRSGRYGPYTTDGEVNASLPRGEAPESLTLERAVELLTARAAAAPARKGRRGAKKTAGASKKTTAASPGRKPKTAARAKEALPGSIDAGETAAAPKKPSVRKAGTRKKS